MNISEQFAKIELAGGCNTPNEVIMAQVAHNIRRGLPQLWPHDANDNVVALVCGGPSLATMERDLVDAVWHGAKVVAVNGAFRWCVERNIKPSACIVLDAREFNSRFVEPDVPECKYFLASQCHPTTFDICSGRDVYIWHACTSGEPEHEMLKDYYLGRVYPVTLGTTIGVRALSVLRMVGFTGYDVFGLDGCFLDGKHHAYEQNENNNDAPVEVILAPEGHPELGQTFVCSPWMMQQCEDFQELIRERGDLFRINVRGPGVIAAMVRMGMNIKIEENKPPPPNSGNLVFAPPAAELAATT
jgi:hypothetical protein